MQTVEAKEAFIERTAYVGQTTGGFYWTDSKRRPTKDRQKKEAYAGQTAGPRPSLGKQPKKAYVRGSRRPSLGRQQKEAIAWYSVREGSQWTAGGQHGSPRAVFLDWAAGGKCAVQATAFAELMSERTR